MPADRSETYQLQTQQGNWPGALPVQKGHATIGGKVYPTVKMPDGSVWMAQNLDMTWTGLMTCTDYSDSYTTASCAYWQFDQTTYGDRGLFYNSPARDYLQNNTSTLCPGWHIPTGTELINAMQFAAVSDVDVFSFALTVYGYGYLRTYSGNQGWYESNPGSADQNKAYMLQYAGSGYSWGYYVYIRKLESGFAGPYSNSWVYGDNIHMPIRLVMDDPSQFVPDTTEDSNTRVTYKKYYRPWVVLEFSDSSFVPTWNLNSGLSGRTYDAKWERVSTSPNRWKCTVTSCKSVGNTGSGYGLAFLFDEIADSPYNPVLIPANMNNGTCKIIDWGNLDNTETMDRFAKANTGITQIPSTISFGSYITNVNEMFSGCTEVTGGALALYNVMKDIPTITSHADTFKNCGSNTQTGQADLALIPLSWGGTLAPPSTSTTFIRVESSNPKYKWYYDDTNGPDWSTNPVLYIFTESSLSQYAGINMRKTTTGNIQNGLTRGERYYQPAFVQFDSGSSGAISWVLTTTGYNGHLGASTSAGDMPGTLSYDNFGPTDQHFGTYDSSKTVYFCFLVTNVTIDNWGGLTDAYGIQGNNFYNPGFYLKWFTA